jgi:hypothetical protein
LYAWSKIFIAVGKFASFTKLNKFTLLSWLLSLSLTKLERNYQILSTEDKYSLNNFPVVIVVLLVFAASPFSKSEVNSSPSTVANLEVAILYTTTSDERSQVVDLLLAGCLNMVIFGNPQSVKIA